MMQPQDTNLIVERSEQCNQKTITTSPIKQSWAARLSAYVRKEIVELRHFLAKPVRRFSSKSNLRDRWKRVLLLAAIGLTFSLIYILSIGLALDTWTTIENDRDVTSGGIIFIGVFVAPLMEEIIFRAGLRNLKYSLFVGPALISLLFGQWQIAAGIFLLTMFVASYLNFLSLDRRKHKYTGEKFRFGRQFIEHYPKIFWLYAGAFSMVHIANYKFSDASGLLVVFAVIPQLSMGILWGYVRLRDGLSSSIALHSLNNLIVFSLFLVLGD
ncbi:type II CAAX prenyl endopeptidase Rce1 family protein [Undibacterium sp.]|uniref:CPBP family glutamic-type intramembrane protease n=1 Tax=Undibacterium sp. TaxID=1914977 RepID=UPI003752CA26